MNVPVMRIWDEAKQEYVGVPAISGPPGDPGKTPVKGVDYFTEEDIQEIAKATSDKVKPYEHPDYPGYKHIPSGGSKDKILRWSEAGTAKWDDETVYTHPTFEIGGETAYGNQKPAFGDTFTVQFPYADSQGHMYSKVDRTVTIPNSTATASAAGLMSATDKAKLDGIAAGANNYTHPTSSGNKHIPSGGTKGDFLTWSANGEAKWSKEVTASSNANGLMSATDKSKLDGIANNANYYVHPNAAHLPSGSSAGQFLVHGDKGGVQWSSGVTATSSANGLMSATDKAKLDGLAAVASSGSYNDLSNRPSIPTVPTNVSAFANDAGYLTAVPSEYVTESELAAKKYITGVPSEYVTESELAAKGYLTQHQSLTAYAKKSDLATVAVTGSYSDLVNKPTIPSMPTKVSQLQNDAGYITGAAIPTSAHMYTLWTGSTDGDISLNGGEQASSYDFMDIEYTDGTRYMTQRVYAPNNKSVEISRIVSNGSATYLQSSVLTISGNGITQGNKYQTTLTDSGDTLGISATSPLKVTRVVGWQIW